MTKVLAGSLSLLLLGLLVGGAFAALVLATPRFEAKAFLADPYLRHVVLFTLAQALASTVLSVGLALPVARALARRSTFPGRDFLLRLFSLPLVTPTLAAILGIVAVFGQTGLVNRAAAALGLPPGQYLYGLAGILIAHLFFNLPLAVRLLLPAWRAVPGESWRLASQLGMRSGDIWRVIEWPLIRQILPGTAGIIFMLCFTSFSVVLTLGGGPAATTLEVAIYQALRLEFDLGRAVVLSLVQIGLCAAIIGVALMLGREVPLTPALGRLSDRPDLAGFAGRVIDTAALAAAMSFIALPLIALLSAGLTGPLGAVLADPRLWRAGLRSLTVAVMASVIAMALGAAILTLARHLRVRRGRKRGADAVELAGSLTLVVPPLVLGAGLFVLLSPVSDVFAVGLALVTAINAVMGLPYVLRVLGPAMDRTARRYDRLCDGLDLRGWNRLRLVEWPSVRREAGLALALVAALSMGDLGAIALFGTQDSETLALLLYRRMGAYRMDAAAATALVLLAVCLALFAGIERVVGGRAATRS
jgi:thiamine transport system permease protein